MADNFDFDEGVDSTGAADDCAGVKYQIIKVADGTADSTTVIKAGGGVEADALRVTIANNSTGVLSVDDGGGALTVDGTVAVTNAGLTELATAIDTQVQVDVVAALPAGTNNIGDVDIASALPAGTNAIGKLAANSGVDIGDVDILSIAAGDNNIGNVDVVTLPPLEAGNNNIGNVDIVGGTITTITNDVGLDAGENHIGEVGMPDTVITITPTLDTSAYADGDVLFTTEAIANAVRNDGESCILQSIQVLDKADQGIDFELVFFDADKDLGTANAAITISDADAASIIGHYAFSNDYIDLINSQIRCDEGIGLVLKAGAATTSLYVGGISKGAGTYAASDIVIKLGLLRN